MNEEQAKYFKQIGSDPEFWSDKAKTLQAIKRRKDKNFKLKCACGSELGRNVCTCDVWAERRKERLKTAERES